ncbi:hypothetical protein [Breoghania sp.]|uniref:hypothetical protein n=1 Tax=Breoghania sp. TaxID=2065378 RepID=UPI002622C65E|nr:hypothetical protein [Breoghania sp.]MDJ0929932.1 hypothetical protein [Breoghania sp.]
MRSPFVGTLLFLTAAALGTKAGTAYARADTHTLTCAQVQALVRDRGAITVTTGAHTYERVVADKGYCLRMEITQPAYVPSNDSRQCFAGFRCVPITILKMYD